MMPWLKLSISFFWTKVNQKGYFQTKTKKVNISNEFCIFKLVWGSKFQLKMTTLIFGGTFVQNWFPKKLHFCMSPWSLLTTLTSFERWPTDTTTLQVYSPSNRWGNKECSEYSFCKKFTFVIYLPNYLFIWIVEPWSVPSIFKTLDKI